MEIPIILAEVSDKVPSKGAFLIVCAVFLCAVSFFAVKRWLWPMLLEFTIIGIGTVMIVQEFMLDRFMRDAIIAEQGVTYFVIALVSLIFPVIMGITLFVTRKKENTGYCS